MTGNSFGRIFRITTFGESHGPAVGVVIDGCPSGLHITEKDIQSELKIRRPGFSEVSTSRKEPDQPEIISGISENLTTGAPICIIIKNTDARPKDYTQIKDIIRPGHANFTHMQKFGLFDHNGAGRASARETAARVAAGAIAKKILEASGISIKSYSIEIAGIKAKTIDTTPHSNDVRCLDASVALDMKKAIIDAKKNKDSVGGIIETEILGCPAGLGEPVFDRLEADLAKALMSIPGVKGFEIGSGFEAARMKGSENNDTPLKIKNKRLVTKTNNSGGVLGGISTGMPIICRISVKPTSTILSPQKSIDLEGNPATLNMPESSRHDPCIVPRVIPVTEAMASLVLVDHILLQDRNNKLGVKDD